MGAQVRFEDRTWQVTALVDGRVYLAAGDGATGCVLAARLVAADGFEVVGRAAPQVPAAAVWADVPLPARERAMAWLRHIREVETGLPGGPGSGGVPRPEYDPQVFTLAEREHAKAKELAGRGWTKVSRPTVQRMRLAYQRQGLLGLVDKRSLRASSPTGRTDERVVAAVLEALRVRRGRSKTTTVQVIELAEQIVAQTHGKGRVTLPARSSLYRLVKALADPAEPPGSPARTATGPDGAGGTAPALRPAERVHVATARLGIEAVGEDGRAVAVSVTCALDGATGCVLAAVLHPQQAAPVELSVLLAEMAVPRTARPGWREMLRAAHEALPLPQRLMPLDARIEAAVARPAALPQTLVFDPAAAAVTPWFLAVCESLGVSLEAAPVRRRGLHRVAGETVQTLGGLFTRHCADLAGARGVVHPSDSAGRQAEAFFSLPHLRDVLDEWITARWHTRPQQALRHPLLPKAALGPQEMWRVLLGVAGSVPVPLSGQDFAELLPVQRQAVTESGIRLGGRRYDHECLDEHRGRARPTTDDGRWEVHHHPYDMRQIYIRLPDGLLHEIPWTEHAHALRPFDDAVRRRTGQILAARSDPPGHPPPAGGGPEREAGAPVPEPGEQGLVADPQPSGGTPWVPDGTGQAGTLWDAWAEAEQW
ncbi:Mu transposase C-terminal domain-containing protein [Streptomyces sp. 35G-GA-8]|uniref:Mu transposase C-terminal domain-containing protein n=1 Tax=Streptomyces sp. 35G-GA-8 TaxID=2939434 RepID=UPI00201F7059|nr:Mu transposase C-terminal domain-containing protein [Streptomyces sp. 35G-GA-8]MCL7382516.1 Mu transposase C-terminal domain-containing protein [Streptomyces sp. 35G-GA-8]